MDGLWIAVWCAAMALAGWRGNAATARRCALVAGSSLVFLALYAGTYGAVTGLLWSGTVDEYIEIGIKLYCVSSGGWLVWQGLKGSPGTEAAGEVDTRHHAPNALTATSR
ncbi:hypothetical protein [Haliangium sp.]|uniref:hypothetical protein n=1 Tax=Haliangium sp. TaxID=2663208 RepID=UPI003D0A1F41